jgi:hypothetical protein
MDALLYWIGIFLLIDLAFDVVLGVAFWIRARRSGQQRESDAARGFLAASGCLTACLVLLFLGVWMLTKVSQ